MGTSALRGGCAFPLRGAAHEVCVLQQVARADEAVGAQRIIDPPLAAAAMRIWHSPLSAHDVLVAATSDASVADIAGSLNRSEARVGNKVSSASGKLRACNRASRRKTAA